MTSLEQIALLREWLKEASRRRRALRERARRAVEDYLEEVESAGGRHAAMHLSKLVRLMRAQEAARCARVRARRAEREYLDAVAAWEALEPLPLGVVP